MADVLDYSAGFPAPSAIVAGGFVGIVRYIGTPGRAKNLTKTEARLMRAAGIPIALVYEDSAGWMLEGYDAGVAAARASLRDAANCEVGVRNIYFADDVDTVTPAQFAAVNRCLDGGASILTRARTGIYGEADVIDSAIKGQHATWGWQTRAWSGGRVSTRAHLLQQIGYVNVGGVQCDRSTILKSDWGQWPVEEEDVTPEDVDAISDAVVTKLTNDTAFGLSVRRQLITALADPTHAYLQDELQPIKTQVMAVATALASNAVAFGGQLADTKSAVLAAVATLPTSHLTDEDRSALARDIADLVSGLEPVDVEAALRHVFADAGDASPSA